MKNFLLLLIAAGATIFSSAQTHRIEYGQYEINDAITISVNSNCYYISFTQPEYEVIINEDGFSEIILPESPNLYYLELPGMPNLPVYSINLPISQYSDLEIINYEIVNISYNEIPTSALYAPFQAQLESYEQTESNFQIANNFYFGEEWVSYYHNHINISEPYSYLGVKGFTINLMPFTYNPINGTLLRAKHIAINIPLIEPLEDILDNTKLKQAQDMFDISNIINCSFNYKPKYHIIIPDQYVSDINDFVDYKTACNYDVIVHEVFCGISPLYIRELIRTFYETSHYVLLVGDKDCIPYSFGVEDSPDSPPTDLYYYSGLDKYYFEYGKFEPNILFGRWPVSCSNDIYNLTYKTIEFETNIYEKEKRAALFSGDGNGGYSFKNNATSVLNRLTNAKIGANLYDGRKYSENDLNYILKSEMQNNLWMFFYRGHGNYAGPANPYFSTNNNISSFVYATTPPITFLFACSTLSSVSSDGYNVNPYAKQWIANNVSYGGVASYASTEVSYREYNNTLSKKMFGYLETGANYNIANWITAVEYKYHQSGVFNKLARLSHISKYNLMGDPSLKIYGRDNFINFSKANSKSNDETINIKLFPTISNSQIFIDCSQNEMYTIIVYNIQGQKMFEIKNSDGSFSVSTLPDGLYIAKFIFANGKEEYNKFLVKH